MTVIHKYMVYPGPNSINIPEGAKFLSVHNQNGNICLWALVNPSNKKEVRYIPLLGTGQLFHDDVNEYPFIGTVLVENFVWHVFDGGKLV